MPKLLMSQQAAQASRSEVWRGAWQSGRWYNALDFCGESGYLWTCIEPHIATVDNQPGSGAGYLTYWAKRGDDYLAPGTRDALENAAGTPSEANPFVLADNGGLPLRFLTVAEAEAAIGIADNRLAYVVENATLYGCEANGSAYTRNGTFVLNTGDGGDKRLLAIAGKFTLAGLSSVLIGSTTERNPNEAFRVSGVDRGNGTYYLLTIDKNLPGLRTNAFICINGANGDPVPTTIAGQTSYMLGINSDLATAPTIVVKTQNGPLFEGYNVSSELIFRALGAGGLELTAPSGYQLKLIRSGSNAANFEVNSDGNLCIGAISGKIGLGASATFPPLFDCHVTGVGWRVFGLSNYDDGTDQKHWVIQTGQSLGGWRLRALNDAASNGENAIVVSRNGYEITGVDFPNGPVTVGEEFGCNGVDAAGLQTGITALTLSGTYSTDYTEVQNALNALIALAKTFGFMATS